MFHRVKYEIESTSGAVLLFSVNVRALKRSNELHLQTLQRALADYEARSGTNIAAQRTSVMEEATGPGGAELEAILLDCTIISRVDKICIYTHKNIIVYAYIQYLFTKFLLITKILLSFLCFFLCSTFIENYPFMHLTINYKYHS